MSDMYDTAHQNTVINARINALKDSMNAHNLYALIIPTNDPHMSEYLPKHWQARAYFSGFDGSAGTLVVAQDFAHLWTDTRYWLQAEDELAGTNIVLKKIIHNAPDYVETLRAHAPENARIGIWANITSFAQFNALADMFGEENLVSLGEDFFDAIWINRPLKPVDKIYAHNAKFVDKTVAQKIAKVQACMQEEGVDFHLISSLDDIGYLTNLRGSDAPCNPVFLAHLLIKTDGAALFVDTKKLDETIIAQLKDANIDIFKYDDITLHLAKIDGTLWADFQKVSTALIHSLPKSVNLINKTNPSTLHKAIKSDRDVSHIKNAMIQDGAALCEFFACLEEDWQQGVTIFESDIATRLTDARQKQPHYVDASFETIAGFNGNGAVVHYQAKKGKDLPITNGLLLIDSGAQYQNGTTDITRMIGFGDITDAMRFDITHVLKAHIALACAVFIKGTPAPALDCIARAPMWKVKLDYGHGTGHGVGYFMNVHEGPQVIAYSAATNEERIMQKGMITSNEPGLYRAKQYGIRIENLLLCSDFGDSQFGKFLCFETLTLCPIDTRLIDKSLLDNEEISWLNDYHKTVHDALIAHVDGIAKDWLIARTEAI